MAFYTIVSVALEGSVFSQQVWSLGLFLQDFLAAVQVTHELHLLDNKGFYLPLTDRMNKNVLTLILL